MGFPLPEIKSDEPAAMQVDLVPPTPPPPPAAPAQEAATPATPPAPEGKPVPQLAEGDLADKSTPVPEKQGPSPAKATALSLQSVPKPVEKKPAPINQNERDWVLSRVLHQWQAPPGLAAYQRADIRLKVTVLADGHFSDIYDSRRAWNPNDVFDGYGALSPQSLQRRTIDSVYGAIRKAQPLALPAALKAKAPFDLRLDFRFKDAR